MSQQRLFFGAVLPSVVQAHFKESYKVLRRQFQGISLTKPENLHLTLHFIGEVDPNAAQTLSNMFVAQEMPSQEAALFRVSHYGFFTRPGGSLLWAVLDVDPGLTKWRKEFGQVLADMGHTIERRPWNPHVTLARRGLPKESKTVAIDAMPVPDALFSFSGLALFESYFTPRGLVYEVLVEKAFGAPLLSNGACH